MSIELAKSVTVFSAPYRGRRQDVSVEREGVVFKDSFLKSRLLVPFAAWWHLVTFLKEFLDSYDGEEIKPPLDIPQAVRDDIYVCSTKYKEYSYLDVRRCRDGGKVPTKDGIRLSAMAADGVVNSMEQIDEMIQERGNMLAVKHSLPPPTRGAIDAMLEWCSIKLRNRESYCSGCREGQENQMAHECITGNVDKVFEKVYAKMGEKEVGPIFLKNMGFMMPAGLYLESSLKYKVLIKRHVIGEDISIEPPFPY